MDEGKEKILRVKNNQAVPNPKIYIKSEKQATPKDQKQQRSEVGKKKQK